MKYFLSSLIYVVSAQLLSSNIVFAQTLNLKIAPANIIIDGNIKEWGDSLAYTDDKTKLNYTLANDKDNLYLVIRTNNLEQQSDVLGGGITFSVDVKGRNKASYALTFPAGISLGSAGSAMDADQIMLKVKTTRFRKIKAEGFSGIDDGQLLSTSNSNGIEVATGYDENGYLTYEELIPLALFSAGKYLDKEWAFNIKLNGLQKSQQGQGQSLRENGGFTGTKLVAVPAGSPPPGMRDRRNPTPAGFAEAIKAQPVQTTQLIDFWGKFILAKFQ